MNGAAKTDYEIGNRKLYNAPCGKKGKISIVGNFAGETSLAAVGACGVLTLVFLALANGFSAGTCVLIAQLFGAGKEQEMRRQALSSLLLMISMGIVATAVGVFISRFVLKYILATPESLLSLADAYFKIYALGLLFQFGYNIIAAILRGIGDSRATLYFLNGRWQKRH